MISQSKLEATPDWHLRKRLRSMCRARDYNDANKSSLQDVKRQHYGDEILQVERELERRKAAAP